MAALSRVAAALALLAAAPAQAGPIDRWRLLIDEAAARFKLPPEWIERVMRAESGGRTRLEGRPITSRAGAMGLMQLMPATWAELAAAHRLGSDPHAPRANILAGAAYLRAMYDRFGYPGLFAAYNAGPARYAEHLASGRPLPAETRAYLAALSGSAPGEAKAAARRKPPSLFLLGGAAAPRGDAAPEGRAEPARSLFLIRRN